MIIFYLQFDYHNTYYTEKKMHVNQKKFKIVLDIRFGGA
jgi:hypothetical protein